MATRAYGRGRIAYIGDVNCEAGTADLVLAFCSSNQVGIAAADLVNPLALTAEEVAEVLCQKNAGNTSFGIKDFTAARLAYEQALEVYGTRPGR